MSSLEISSSSLHLAWLWPLSGSFLLATALPTLFLVLSVSLSQLTIWLSSNLWTRSLLRWLWRDSYTCVWGGTGIWRRYNPWVQQCGRVLHDIVDCVCVHISDRIYPKQHCLHLGLSVCGSWVPHGCGKLLCPRRRPCSFSWCAEKVGWGLLFPGRIGWVVYCVSSLVERISPGSSAGWYLAPFWKEEEESWLDDGDGGVCSEFGKVWIGDSSCSSEYNYYNHCLRIWDFRCKKSKLIRRSWLDQPWKFLRDDWALEAVLRYNQKWYIVCTFIGSPLFGFDFQLP